MIYEFESDVKIDDEILKAELGSNGDVQLKKHYPNHSEGAECYYPKHLGQDHGDSGGCRKRKDFHCPAQDRISPLS